MTKPARTSSEICEKKMMNTLSTTHARMAVWKLKTWRGQRLDAWKFARGCSQASAHKSTVRVPIYCAGQVRGGEGASNKSACRGGARQAS